MMRSVETLLRALELVPAAKLEIDDAQTRRAFEWAPGSSLASISGTAVFS
jgi:hypothetical protein